MSLQKFLDAFDVRPAGNGLGRANFDLRAQETLTNIYNMAIATPGSLLAQMVSEISNDSVRDYVLREANGQRANEAFAAITSTDDREHQAWIDFDGVEQNAV